jgi:hypothetical protein
MSKVLSKNHIEDKWRGDLEATLFLKKVALIEVQLMTTPQAQKSIVSIRYLCLE